jgi:hypothetical protein
MNTAARMVVLVTAFINGLMFGPFQTLDDCHIY